jgi:hypothetical protein
MVAPAVQCIHITLVVDTAVEAAQEATTLLGALAEVLVDIVALAVTVDMETATRDKLVVLAAVAAAVKETV